MDLFLVVKIRFCKSICRTGANLAVKLQNFTLISITGWKCKDFYKQCNLQVKKAVGLGNC